MRTYEYVVREGPYAARLRDPEKHERLEAVGHGGLPSWARAEPARFWRVADQEERVNGRACDMRIVGLPRAIPPLERSGLAERLARELCGDRHPYTWAIHVPSADDGKEQPHIHLMWSTRELDGIERGPDLFFRRHNPERPEVGGARKATTKGLAREVRANAMMDERAAWAEACNEALGAARADVRIDPRSNAARGLLRPPEPKLPRSRWRDPAAKAALREWRGAWHEVEEAEASLRATMRVAPALTRPPVTSGSDLARTLRAASELDAGDLHEAARCGATATATQRIGAALRPRHQPRSSPRTLADGFAAAARKAAEWCWSIEVGRAFGAVGKRLARALAPRHLAGPAHPHVEQLLAEAALKARVWRQEEWAAAVEATWRIDAALCPRRRLRPPPRTIADDIAATAREAAERDRSTETRRASGAASRRLARALAPRHLAELAHPRHVGQLVATATLKAATRCGEERAAAKEEAASRIARTLARRPAVTRPLPRRQRFWQPAVDPTTKGMLGVATDALREAGRRHAAELARLLPAAERAAAQRTARARSRPAITAAAPTAEALGQSARRIAREDYEWAIGPFRQRAARRIERAGTRPRVEPTPSVAGALVEGVWREITLARWRPEFKRWAGWWLRLKLDGDRDGAGRCADLWGAVHGGVGPARRLLGAWVSDDRDAAARWAHEQPLVETASRQAAQNKLMRVRSSDERGQGR